MRGEGMDKKKEQKVEERKSILETRAGKNIEKALQLARDNTELLSKALARVSTFGPIAASFLYLIFPIDFSNFIWWHLAIDVAATGILITALLVLFGKLDVEQRVINRIETDKADRQRRVELLEKKVEQLKGDQAFYVSATQLIGEEMKNGKKDVASLAKALIAAIYHNLSKKTRGDNLTINLYELRNGRIKMIHSTTRLQHCNRSSVDIPVLYESPTGLDSNDESIKDYYCIKCIKGRIRGRDDKYTISDWKKMAELFKWGKWTDEEREEIIKNNDREKCIELGFKYNQYFSFKIKRDDGTTCLFEIIANGDTEIASVDELNHVTHQLRDTYSPMVNILWDISQDP